MTDQSRPVVHIQQGQVQGVRRDGSIMFLGIPFAEPPLGPLRFAAPLPHRAWTGILDASAYGPTPQRVPYAAETLIPEPSIPGESTLNVNVFTPQTGDIADARKLPVLVFFHGGAYVAGSPASPWYDGAGFNRDEVVTVTVSYRLGFDGFGWISDAPHNRAVLDWLCALEWVADNISAFGGDPSRVTIAGQSAGGGAVLTLLSIPAAQHLFERVISLSGLTTNQSLAAAKEYGTRFAQLGSVDPTVASLGTLDELTVIGLQDQMAAELAAGDPLEEIFAMARDGLVLAPYVDGDLIPYSTIAAIRAGIGADKNVLLGSTDQEFNIMVSGEQALLNSQDPVLLLQRMGLSESAAGRYVQARPGLTATQTVGQTITDLLFRAPALAVAQARAASDPRSMTWLYRFGWPSPTMGVACHCLDLPFFFDHIDAPESQKLLGPNPPESLARDLHSTAVTFVQGEPPLWQPWAENTRQAYLFAVPGMLISSAYSDLVELSKTIT